MGIYRKKETQMGLDFSERRRYERVHLELPVSGQCLDVAGDIYPFQGETRDVSFEGFCVKVNSSNGFKVGQNVNFNTRLYRGERPAAECAGFTTCPVFLGLSIWASC
jgi:c-di-GMP-binding flagellar brake protein YcgR